MSVFQHTPDDLIFIRVGMEVYAESVANFKTDCMAIGHAYLGLPTGRVDRIYLQDDPSQHTCADSHGNMKHLSMPDSVIEGYITRFTEIMAAKVLRETPTPEKELELIIESKIIELYTNRDMACTLDILYKGSTYQADSISQQLFLEALVVFSSIGVTPEGFTWRDKFNVDQPFTLIDLQAVSVILATQKNNAFKTTWVLKDKVQNINNDPSKTIEVKMSEIQQVV